MIPAALPDALLQIFSDMPASLEIKKDNLMAHKGDS